MSVMRAFYCNDTEVLLGFSSFSVINAFSYTAGIGAIGAGKDDTKPLAGNGPKVQKIKPPFPQLEPVKNPSCSTENLLKNEKFRKLSKKCLR